jgi:hypothetical protein
MESRVAVFFVLLVGRLFVYNYLEISPLKSGILSAMASQSRELDQVLQELLMDKPDLKIVHKDY